MSEAYEQALLDAEARYGSRGGHMLRRGLAAAPEPERKRGWHIYFIDNPPLPWWAGMDASKAAYLGVVPCDDERE